MGSRNEAAEMCYYEHLEGVSINGRLNGYDQERFLAVCEHCDEAYLGDDGGGIEAEVLDVLKDRVVIKINNGETWDFMVNKDEMLKTSLLKEIIRTSGERREKSFFDGL